MMRPENNQEDNEEDDWMINWDRRRRTAAVQVLCYFVYALKLRHVYYSKHHLSHSATSLKGKKRDAPEDDLLKREFESMREAISSVTEAIREGNAIAKRSRARVYSEEDVFRELVNIGIDERLRYKAYNFLTQDATRVRALFGCPIEERKNFLLQLMYGPRNL